MNHVSGLYRGGDDMVDEESETVLVAKALDAARKAFEDVFEQEGIDPVYFALDLRVRIYNVDWTVSRVIIDLDNSVTEGE